MFTKQQAIELVEKSWMIDNVEKQLENNRKNLLNKIIVTIEEKVPFNYLFTRTGLFGIIPCEQTLENVEKHCMCGNGGNCTVLSLFTYSLLKGLGYSALFCPTTVTTKQVNPHFIVIVKDLEKDGDVYLVECGLGLPSFQAIPLDFEQESPVYKDSFLEYKFIRRGEKILRMHGQGDMVNHRQRRPLVDFNIGKWRRFYFFTPSDALEVNNILADIGDFPYAVDIKSVLPPRAARFPGQKAVIIIENRLFLERHDKTLKQITMDTKDEIFKAYQIYFPMIDPHVVSQAYADWSQTSSKL